MQSNNTIEINGKLYDAKTGALLNTPTGTKRSVAPAVKRRQTSASVDGFSRQRKQTQVTPNAKSAPKTATSESTPASKSSAGRTTAKTVKQANRKSLTLNRSGVQSPKKTSPTQKVSVATEKSEKKLSSTALKHADSQRLERAQQVSRSSAIARFKTTQKKSEPTVQAEISASPLTSHLSKMHKSTPEEPVISTKERLIKQAMASAVSTTPTTKKHKSSRNHFGKYASSALVVLVLAGYIAYLNVPSISMKVAAQRAGFAATMPSYKPAGYSLRGPIAYNPGQVTVNFKSNTDDRQFSLKQQPTTWDSTALLENYVTKQNPNYLTYQDRGLTIYIYEGSSAAWVNGGTFYHVDGKDSKLDTDQLLKLATSV